MRPGKNLNQGSLAKSTIALLTELLYTKFVDLSESEKLFNYGIWSDICIWPTEQIE